MTDFQKARELALRAMAQREEGSEQRWATFGETLDAALSAFSAAGYEVLPVKCSDAMLDAAWNATRNATPEERFAAMAAPPRQAHNVKMRHRHAAMIQAALKERT